MSVFLYSGSQNNLHCSCKDATSNGAAMCTGGVLARKVPNHSSASPGQSNKRPAVSLTHLPKRPPVDVEFKNLAYSVSEGRKRGRFRKKNRRLTFRMKGSIPVCYVAPDYQVVVVLSRDDFIGEIFIFFFFKKKAGKAQKCLSAS